MGIAKYYTTCFSICAYTKIFSYIMALNTSTWWWGEKKPHQDPEVQAGYMQALDKLYSDEEECYIIRRQLSHYINSNGAFRTNHANRDRGNLPSLEWWDMHGNAAPQLLSQVVNTSSAERCWSTYSFIHSVKRNRFNVKPGRELGLSCNCCPITVRNQRWHCKCFIDH